MYLIAIVPPNHAETALMKIKRAMFQKFDSVSAWSLRPLVPVCSVERNPADKAILAKLLPVLPEKGLPLEKISESANQLFFTSDTMAQYSSSIENLFADYKILERYRGLHIADIRDTPEAAPSFFLKECSLLPESIFCWKSGTLAVFKTGDQLFSITGWWERVVFETVFEVQLPKFRKT